MVKRVINKAQHKFEATTHGNEEQPVGKRRLIKQDQSLTEMHPSLVLYRSQVHNNSSRLRGEAMYISEGGGGQ
jgi:hypothetical protein